MFTSALQLQQDGRLAGAEALYRQILAVEPAQAAVHYNLGIVLRRRGDRSGAVACFARALELQPRFPEAANNLGAAYEHSGLLDDAEAAFRLAVRLQPDFAEAWSNLAGVLKSLGRVIQAGECLDHACALQPDKARLASNRLFTLQYGPADDPALLREAAQAWGERFADPLTAAAAPHPNDRTPGRRLRVGYVSACFREHCQAFFTIPLFTHHAGDRFEVFAYSDVAEPDPITTRLQGCTATWRSTRALSDAELAAQIRADEIDVLVDLTLHMAHDRLGVFARKPAPVQVTWLGYPGTTGMRAMDSRLTDPWLDPLEAGDAAYGEKSYRLPDSFWCYDPLTDEPRVSPLPALRTGRITFGCLNNFCKVTDVTLAIWSRVLQAVPDSRLLLLAPSGSARERVRGHLGSWAARVEFIPYQPRADYLQTYHRIDVCLDTFPYNGHTTSLDAFWMGVPVVSLSGRTAVSRAGLSLAENLGLPGLVARSPVELVDCATNLARDRDGLAALRAGLRERMTRSPLMDATRFTRHVEDAYRSMWRDWCAKNVSW